MTALSAREYFRKHPELDRLWMHYVHQDCVDHIFKIAEAYAQYRSAREYALRKEAEAEVRRLRGAAQG